VIDIVALSFGYGAGPAVVEDFSHSFPGGSMVGISGPSGRGKSTLLYLAGLLLQPRSGRVVLDGIDTSVLSDPARSRLRSTHIGFVFQDAVLDTGRSILDNVIEGSVYSGLSRSVAKQRGRALLAQVNVSVPIDRRPGQISGGQAQRVALCRALLHEPSVVLADEPTGNLDRESADLALARLRTAAESGACVLIASHDHQVLDRCDDTVVLD